MQAIILAAGEGSRMRPLTAKLPKVMLPVCGRPLLEHIVLRAKQAGVDSFVLVVGYGADSVKSYFSDGSNLGVRIDYAVQECQLGTGHALMSAEAIAEDRFVVLNGDVLLDVESLNRVISGKGNIVAAKRVHDPSRYGVFVKDGAFMKSVIEKSKTPPSDLANAGIYLFDRGIFESMKKIRKSMRGEYELTDGLNALAAKERIRIVEIEDWIEIGRPWDILEANERLMQDIEPSVLGEIEPFATLKGKVSVGRGTVVRSGSYIVGPVVIGEDCDIGPNCYIRPVTCMGNNVRVGNAVEVKNSAIMDGTKVGHLSYIGDSVVGTNCNFGAGTVASNLRHDNANVRSYIKGLPVDSSRRKLGVIMGDDVKTGINTTIYPGTVIESGCRSMPAAELSGMVCAQPKGQRDIIF